MLGSGPGGWTQGAGRVRTRGAGPRWYTQCYFSNFLLTLGSGPRGWTGPDLGGAGRVQTWGGWMGPDPGVWTQGAAPMWYTHCDFSNFLLTLGSRSRGLDPGGWTGPDPGPPWTQEARPRWYTQCYFSNFLLMLGSRPRGLDGSGPGWLDPGGWTQVVHSMLLL